MENKLKEVDERLEELAASIKQNNIDLERTAENIKAIQDKIVKIDKQLENGTDR